MILVNNSSFYDGVLQLVSEQCQSYVHTKNLKMTDNVFMMRNVFCPHKDYSSFLGGKLTMFNLCNYGKGMV
jgi:hypothetical protein